MIKTNQGYLITREHLSSSSPCKQPAQSDGSSEQLAKPSHGEMDRAGEGQKQGSLVIPAKQSAASEAGNLQTTGPVEHSKNTPR